MSEHKKNPKAEAKRAGSFSGSGADAPPIEDLATQHGHNGTHVVLLWSRSIDHLYLTPDQVDDHIRAITETKRLLLEHLAKFPAGTKDERPLGPRSDTPQ